MNGTKRINTFIPTTCDLCPPSYGWCPKHDRCEHHCACQAQHSVNLTAGQVD